MNVLNKDVKNAHQINLENGVIKIALRTASLLMVGNVQEIQEYVYSVSATLLEMNATNVL